MTNRLTDSLDFQAQALVLRSERQRVIASNIANVDTPGYVSRDMDFASALREATNAASGASGATGMTGMTGSSATDPAHIPLTAESAGALALKYSAPSQTNLDSNTVDMDRERASSVDNSVKYEASLRFINTQVKYMLDAMKSPSQG
ncbi:MAG TPA: flagellar basal body rod protein FlgB [Burkholderiaceae bacterium]|nr:flagellar basal body rod protein FlgB [Burkholderiaceae bacterium]